MSEKKILDAIINDAEAERDRILADAEAAADRVVAEAEAAAKQRAAVIAAEADADCAELERRAMLGAQLAARKNSLAKRRELLENAFGNALSGLCRLPKAGYARLVTRLVLDAAEGTETVDIPEEASDYYTKPFENGKTLLDLLNDALKKAGKKGELRLGEKTASFRGGVRLIGEESDADCTFESLVAAFRDERESEVSKLLFTEE